MPSYAKNQIRKNPRATGRYRPKITYAMLQYRMAVPSGSETGTDAKHSNLLSNESIGLAHSSEALSEPEVIA